MNKYQLYTLGGALLGATSLAGTASAGTFGMFKGSTFSTGSIVINKSAFSTTASTANGITINAGTANTGAKIALAFTNSYDSSFNLNVTIPITGASYQSKPTLGFMIKGSGGSYASTVGGSTSTFLYTQAPSVSALASTLFIQNLQLTSSASVDGGGSLTLGGVVFQGVTFNNASGLATSGGTISLQASVASQTSPSLVYETTSGTTIVSSAAPLAVSVSGTAGTVKVGTAPSQFTTLSSATDSLSLTLATVAITSTGAVGTDLSIALDADGSDAGFSPASGSVNVTVTSAALSDPAVSKLIVATSTKVQTVATLSQFTPGVFTAGTVTFTLTQGTNTYATSFNVILAYDGSTAISAASTAGTVTAVLASGGSSIVAPGSGSGSAATVTRGGLSAEVSWANAGTGSGFTSYVRIHNKGTASSTATIVVTKDTTDGSAISTLGTVTTGTIAAGGTIQVGVPAIESSLGINSSTAGGSYTLRISGGFPGYVQHLSYNGSSLFDLSGFRNGSDGTNSAP